MSELSKRFFTSIVLIILLILTFKYNLVLLLLLVLINFLVLIEFNMIFNKIFKNKYFQHFLAMSATLLYMITFTLSAWIYLIQGNANYKMSIIFFILICIATDIGGFIFGKIIGGKKFTKISPNKTYSGVVGSFILSLTLGFLFYKEFNHILSFDINIIVLIVLISFISQCGDLLISFIKRKAKIKDTGQVLPGHGGILDRIDGILFAIPLGILIMLF